MSERSYVRDAGIERRSSMNKKCVPTLRVRDASAACRYFSDQLGFAKDWEHRFEPGLPLFVSVSRDGVSLHLSEHNGDGPLEVRVYVYVRDPKGLFEEFESRGARIVAAADASPTAPWSSSSRTWTEIAFGLARLFQAADPCTRQLSGHPLVSGHFS